MHHVEDAPASVIQVVIVAGQPAIEALAQRAPVRVITEVTEQRYPDEVEVAAYYVVAEGLTNAVRHAAASEVRVGVVARDTSLIVTVEDDGRGGADLRSGSGLRGLADRVAAVGGQLTLQSPAGGGDTRLEVAPRLQ